MDWGLIDPRAPKEAPLLREEMIYGSKWYYYFAIAEDFILRLTWVMNVSLAEAWFSFDFLIYTKILGCCKVIYLFVYWLLWK